MNELKRINIQGDLYYFQIVGDKVIVNDNYEGIIILDTDLRIVQKIYIADDVCIYNSFVANDETILLNCVDNMMLYLVNISTGEVKSCEIPYCISTSVIMCVKKEDKGLILRTYDNQYFCLDNSTMTISECEGHGEGFVTDGDFESDIIFLDDNKVKYSEKMIEIEKNGICSTILPDEGYYNLGIRIMAGNKLIVFSSYGDNSKANIIIYK